MSHPHHVSLRERIDSPRRTSGRSLRPATASQQPPRESILARNRGDVRVSQDGPDSRSRRRTVPIVPPDMKRPRSHHVARQQQLPRGVSTRRRNSRREATAGSRHQSVDTRRSPARGRNRPSAPTLQDRGKIVAIVEPSVEQGHRAIGALERLVVQDRFGRHLHQPIPSAIGPLTHDRMPSGALWTIRPSIRSISPFSTGRPSKLKTPAIAPNASCPGPRAADSRGSASPPKNTAPSHSIQAWAANHPPEETPRRSTGVVPPSIAAAPTTSAPRTGSWTRAPRGLCRGHRPQYSRPCPRLLPPRLTTEARPTARRRRASATRAILNVPSSDACLQMESSPLPG